MQEAAQPPASRSPTDSELYEAVAAVLTKRRLSSPITPTDPAQRAQLLASRSHTQQRQQQQQQGLSPSSLAETFRSSSGSSEEQASNLVELLLQVRQRSPVRGSGFQGV